MQWAIESGCTVDEKACACAASGGHVEIIRWLHEHGAAWDEAMLINAAMYGRKDVLVYAREQGLRWTVATYKAAKHAAFFDLARWLSENGCPTKAIDG